VQEITNSGFSTAIRTIKEIDLLAVFD